MAAPSPSQASAARQAQLPALMKNAMRYGNLVLGPLLVVVALVLFGLCTYGSFVATAPVVVTAWSWQVRLGGIDASAFARASTQAFITASQWWLLVLIGLGMLSNALFNYFACLLTPPVGTAHAPTLQP